MQRRPELRGRKAQHINPAHAQKLNRFVIKDYFVKQTQVLKDLSFFDQPHRIYNLDKKGCRLTLHHRQTAITEKGRKGFILGHLKMVKILQ